MFNLISEMLGQNSILYHMYMRRLGHHIELQQNKFNYSSYDPNQNELVSKSLRGFSKSNFSPLFDLVSNEIWFDLISGYKNQDASFRGRRDIIDIINLTHEKYDSYIRAKIAHFYNDLSKLRNKLKKEKWKIKKIKRVITPQEPIRIPLDIRFAIIKRANGTCEECSSSIFKSPIEVFQIKPKEKIEFIAYCEKCAIQNQDIIMEEPDEEQDD